MVLEELTIITNLCLPYIEAMEALVKIMLEGVVKRSSIMDTVPLEVVERPFPKPGKLARVTDGLTVPPFALNQVKNSSMCGLEVPACLLEADCSSSLLERSKTFFFREFKTEESTSGSSHAAPTTDSRRLSLAIRTYPTQLQNLGKKKKKQAKLNKEDKKEEAAGAYLTCGVSEILKQGAQIVCAGVPDKPEVSAEGLLMVFPICAV